MGRRFTKLKAHYNLLHLMMLLFAVAGLVYAAVTVSV